VAPHRRIVIDDQDDRIVGTRLCLGILDNPFHGTSRSIQRDILALVASGLMNKQVAAELGLAEITVKIYRGQIMRKMGAKSLADLVRMTDALGIPRTRGSLQT
jgi:DNA-binding NarL/FixJ family response regulator